MSLGQYDEGKPTMAPNSENRVESLAYSTLMGQAIALQDAADLLEEAAGHLRAKALQPVIRTNANIDLLERAKQLYQGRRARTVVFGDNHHLANGPAWDILLDLYISGQIGKKLSVTDVSLAAGCPPTTALRWIKILVEADFLVREDDAFDSRRTFVVLSTFGWNKMEDALEQYSDVV